MRIEDGVMTSEVTAHSAEQTGGDAWRVSWLPDRVLTRNEAVTAMTLAETIVGQDFSDKRGALIRTFADELDVSVENAVLAVERGV